MVSSYLPSASRCLTHSDCAIIACSRTRMHTNSHCLRQFRNYGLTPIADDCSRNCAVKRSHCVLTRVCCPQYLHRRPLFNVDSGASDQEDKQFAACPLNRTNLNFSRPHTSIACRDGGVSTAHIFLVHLHIAVLLHTQFKMKQAMRVNT